MLNELFVKAVADLATKAAGPQNRVIKVPGEPAHVYHLIDGNGEIQRHTVTPPAEDRKALDIPTVVRSLSATERDGDPAEVWYSRTGVVGLIKWSDRTDRCTFALAHSKPFKMLGEWDQAGGRSLTQGELWALLRTTFAGCTPAHPNLKEQIGQVDIKKAQEASGTVTREKVSVSRKLMAEASGANQLPEVLTVEVPVFDSPQVPTKAQVRVAFDLDAQDERFRLVVLPNQMEAAAATGEAALLKQIDEQLAAQKVEGVPVYYGRPD